MILDDEDIALLKNFFYLEKEEGLWDLVKKNYPECDSDYKKKKKYIFLQRRAKRMGSDIFKIEQNGNASKYILTNNVRFCKRKLPNGVKDCLMIKSENKWIVIQL